MWRNLKITGKLLAGFGVVLVIFALAVGMVWSNLSVVQTQAEFLSDEVVPVTVNNMEVERALYDLFLVVDKIRMNEAEEDMKASEGQEAVVNKLAEELIAFGNTRPELSTPKMMKESLLPEIKQYTALCDQIIALIREKARGMAALDKLGDEISTAARELVTSFHEAATAEISSGRNSESKMHERTDQLYQVALLMQNFEAARRDLYEAIANQDVKALTAVGEITERLKSDIADLKNSTSDPTRQQLTSQIQAKFMTFDGYTDKFVDLFSNKEKVEASLVSAQDKLNDDSSVLTRKGTDRTGQIAEDAQSAVFDVLRLLFIATAICIVLGVGVAVFISRGISKPLNTIVTLTKRAEGGDLTIERDNFKYEGKDEMGVLVEALANMITAQESSLQEVVSVSGSLTDGAGRLANIAETSNNAMSNIKTSIDQVSVLSENNGAALEECNAGIEEMSAGADTVAQSATDSASFISQTTEVATKAIQMVNNVIQGMHDVDTNSKESEAKIKQLVASVENVSGFVSVITGIADQTNLLALNAAIEAARAGEVGRGFAVVAAEVRKLAEESARAAQNVNGIIVELQKGAHDSIEATAEAGRMLGKTLVQAEAAQKRLDEAMKEINKANDSIQNIAAVAEEQAASSKEVASGIDSATKATMEMVSTVSNIGKATEETVEAARGVAEQAESITGYVDRLNDVLSRFKLIAAETAAPPAKANKALTPGAKKKAAA
ncbi:MAG: methyl-accepting chemotaxis protein [Synergistaceae bacterium]|jgi:methyl-accepting chemotaxis protein|nr:methyl-accepting chemotaxis protein [Synergistaceae bacterium]